MLTIEIKVNGKLIGGAQIENTTALSDTSDYRVLAVEKAEPMLGIDSDMRETFPIADHIRCQTVWALVSKVATEALRRRGGGI